MKQSAITTITTLNYFFAIFFFCEYLLSKLPAYRKTKIWFKQSRLFDALEHLYHYKN